LFNINKILILVTTTLILFSIFSINSNAGELIGVGQGPALLDVTVAAGQSVERTIVAYNPFDTDVEAKVIVSDNLKEYVQANPETIFIEKHTTPENAKVIKLAISAPMFSMGDEDIKGEITLRGTGGMVSPAVGSTFYLHVKGMSIFNLSLIVVGFILVFVALIFYLKKRGKKRTIKPVEKSVEPIDFSSTKTNLN